MKKSIYNLSLTILLALLVNIGRSQVTITNDSIFHTTHQMLLANELNESGEPFAEALGYNLDDLDPMVLNSPDSTSYTFGIENYEYSRYLLQALGAQSGMGLHLMWSPMIEQMAAMQPSSFDGMYTGGMTNGFKEDDMLMMMMGMFSANANQMAPAGAFPQFADFMTGNNNLPQVVAPNFEMDFSSTRWDRSKMDYILNPGAMGQSLMKQYLWAQDMLGAFHDSLDNTIDADGIISPDSVGSPNFDPNNNVFYGGNNLDGFMGQMLTGVGINKAMFLLDKMAYNGTTLGAINPMTYNPSNGIQYFPHQIAVTETQMGGMLPPMVDSTFTLIDASSHLFDQLSFLWGTTGFKNMMDPSINDTLHFAYHEVFDGSPFPAPMSQTGVAGPFDLMMGTSMVLFQNIMAMHYDATNNTFVDVTTLSGGTPVIGNTISAETAGYALVILSDFAKEFTGTAMQTMADTAINAQAAYIINNFKAASGGFYNSFDIGIGANTSAKSISSQAALIRGLYAAYNYTNNSTYLNEANNAYNFLINNFYVPSAMMFKTELGNNVATYTTENLAILAGALREAKLTGSQTDAAIILTRIGATTIDKMVLSEAMQTGETGSDSDGDSIPNIVGGTKPFVFAAEGTHTFNTVGINQTITQNIQINAYPNPANSSISIDINLEQADQVTIKLYDINGKLVLTTPTYSLIAGQQTIKLDLTYLVDGTYFTRIVGNKDILGIEKLIVKH